MKLRNKLILTIVVIVLVFGSIATTTIFIFSRNILVEKEKDALLENTINQTHEIGRVFEQSQKIVATIASQEESLDHLQKQEGHDHDHLLQHYSLYNIADQYSSIYLMNKEGLVEVSTDLSFEGNNYGFRDYFNKAISYIEAVDMVVGVTSGDPGYYFSHAVSNSNNQVEGVVVAKMEPMIIHEIILEDADRENINLMMVDEHGVVVFSNKQDIIYKSLGVLSQEELQIIEEKKRFSGQDIVALDYGEVLSHIRKYQKPATLTIYDEHDKEQEIIAISRISNLPFYLVAEKDEQSLIASALSFSRLMGMMIIFGGISAAVIMSFLISRFLSPLSELGAVVEKISKGDFSQRVQVSSKYEVGSLSQAFNKMVDAIKSSRSQVDIQVKEQTKKIIEKESLMEDQQKAVLNILEDVDFENKKSQALANDMKKFKLAAENATDQIVITDSDGTVLFANKATTKISGYSQEEVIGQKAGGKHLWGGHMELAFYKKFWKAIKEDKKDFSGEFNNQRKTGEKYIAEAHVSPIVNDKGEVIFFVAIERDVTKAKEVDRMKTEFLSLASHQLRTPLSAMKWFLEMLLKGDMGKLTKEQQEALDNINESNERMIELVSGLLNVSRIETGRIIIDPKPTNLIDLLKEVLTELRPTISAKKIKLTVKVSKGLPEISIDPKLIREVYKNLLTNAIKYSPEKTEVIVIISKNDQKIVSKVTDSGFGIPKKDQARIFEKFFRAENVVKKETDGNGLGLYLVESVVKASGGRVGFESEENKGSSFWFTLPMAGSKSKKGEVSLDPS